MILEIVKEKVWIPKYRENDKAPENQQIRFHHRFLTPGESQKFRHYEDLEMDMETGKPVSRKRKWIEDMPGIVSAVVFKIDNLQVKKGDKTSDVDTGTKLYNSEGVPQDLIIEAELYFRNAADPEIDVRPFV